MQITTHRSHVSLASRDAVLSAVRAGVERRGISWESFQLKLGQAGVRFPRHARILGESMKVKKGEKYGVLTAILYMAPHRTASVAGVHANACPDSTVGCRSCCLGCMSPRLRMDGGRNAKLWKSVLYHFAPGHFARLLHRELTAHEAKAKRKGLTAAVRLDGCTDLGLGRAWAPAFPGIMFYDYTKSVERMNTWLGGRRLGLFRNEHLTFSWSGENWLNCFAFLQAGGTVAVPFRSLRRALRFGWQGFPVIDGDNSDFRPFDAPGVVVGLSVKGQGLPENTHGFIVENV